MAPMRIALALLIVAASACQVSGTTETTTTTASPTTIGPLTTSTTEVSATALGCGGRPADYRTDGPLGIVGGPGADAQQISRITLTQTGDCERLAVALSTSGGAPATNLPRTEVELIAGSGVVRMTFDPAITASAITDSLLEGTLVERAYVVQAADGSIYVDAHLRRSVAARTFVRDDPAQVAIELQATEAAATGFPQVIEDVVVTGPWIGSIEYPIVVTGYARTANGQVVARVLAGDATETEVTANTADASLLWGEFTITIEEGPGGDIALTVGPATEDGSTAIELLLSAG